MLKEIRKIWDSVYTFPHLFPFLGLSIGGMSQYAFSDANELVGFGQDCSLTLAPMPKKMLNPIVGYDFTNKFVYACGNGVEPGNPNKEFCYKYNTANNGWTAVGR